MRRRVCLALVLTGIACGGDRGDHGDDGGSSVGPAGTAGGTDSADEMDGGERFDVGGDGDGDGDAEGGGDGCMQDVDVVFVMDVSTTMGPFLGKLEQEILVVDQALAALDLPHEPHYGLVVFVDDVLLVDAGAPYTDVAQLQADFATWNAFTSSNQQVGGGNSNFTWPENSLDALFLAAKGFQWRPPVETLRLIIHTTDDTFWDGPTTGNGVAIQHGYHETILALQQEQVRDFSFAAHIGGSCECEDVSPGWFGPYLGMESIPKATHGGVFDIDLVLADQLSLSQAINDAIIETMCDPYPPPG
jgi:hypothetical protein